ncbi:nitronate monooxygenase [Corynebacterium alimapuense]|uniref:Propionate 3-nitronate monooxygenase n=1 Tax=Corynebacterium alimapuense TaxID=1576874 RepID=A0A3M8K622_9CORY|nr:nitronate monooxygenase [Corynebacterium alimapuense]RNE48560.1 oxidoreductase [Corynebacterium alimapuense]
MDIPTIIVAPMAGGPSTPELVVAAANAGSLGFLAPGQGPANVLEGWLSEVGDCRYGVNLFTKQQPLSSLTELRQVAEEIAPGAQLPEVDYSCDFDAKFNALLAAEHPPAVVSATFGPFTKDEIAALHDRGIDAWITVTCPADALAAADLGADALVVQGPEAGGHRSTWEVDQDPDSRSLPELIDAIVTAGIHLPLVAAGGTRERSDVESTLALPGVVAVSCGSAFLLADEAGTSQFNRTLLAEGGESVASRAFSGRVARGLVTEFVREHPDMPAIYPHLAPMLAPLRQADPAGIAYCLVGTDVDKLTSGSVADILHQMALTRG